MQYTVEVYKRDRRLKVGECLVTKQDYFGMDRAALQNTCDRCWPPGEGYRVEIHETFVTKTNIMTGQAFQERYDTPYFCSPSSESYWSM